MKKIVCVYTVLVLIVAVLVFACFAYKNQANKADSIQFPQMSVQKHDATAKISFELDSESKNLLGQTMPKYKIVSSRKEDENYYDGSVFKITDSLLYSNEILDKISGETKKDGEYTRYFYEECNSELIIYENGSFAFRMLSPKEEKLTLTDEEVVKIAEDFIKTYALDSGGFVVGEKRIITNKNTDNDITSKEVVFYRNINNFNVHEKSEISVVVTENGVVAFNSKYSEYEDYKNVKCLSYEDIKNINVFEYKKGQLTYDTSKLFYQAKSVVFNEVEIEYYDAPIKQPELKYIKPIYKFTGLISDHLGNQTECVWLVEAEK